MSENQAIYPIATMCRLLGVSSSGDEPRVEPATTGAPVFCAQATVTRLEKAVVERRVVKDEHGFWGRRRKW